jgi:hypothetical protein
VSHAIKEPRGTELDVLLHGASASSFAGPLCGQEHHFLSQNKALILDSILQTLIEPRRDASCSSLAAEKADGFPMQIAYRNPAG